LFLSIQNNSHNYSHDKIRK